MQTRFVITPDGANEVPLSDAEIAAREAEAAAEFTPAAQMDALTPAVDRLLDAAARAIGYDSIAVAVTYADEPAVPRYQAEGRAFRACRSLTWAQFYALRDEVVAGTRPVPTVEELPGLLPALVLPT